MILFTERPPVDAAWAATEYRVVMCGGGDDTAMLIAELYERGLEPDEIVFCDTGSEFPHTYRFVAFLQQWCADRNWSKVTTLKKFNKDGAPLSVIALAKEGDTLPAAAFGVKSCSLRFKTETADLYFNNSPDCWKAWGTYKKVKDKETGELVERGKGCRLDSHTGSILRMVGINADEEGRAADWSPEHKWVQCFPLFDWDIGEKESTAVERVGLHYPGKSSCYCCPHLTGAEVNMLRTDYPELFEEVQRLESNYLTGRSRTDGPKGLFRKDTIADKLSAFEKGERDGSFAQQRCGACHG